MRLAVVCVSLKAGGTERVVSMLANYLAERHEVQIISLSNIEPFYPLESAVNVVRFRRRGRGVKRLIYYPQVAQFIRSNVKDWGADTVLSCGEMISPFVTCALFGLHVRKIIYNQGTPLRSLGGAAGWINPKLYSHAGALILQTEASRQMLAQKYERTKIVVIPNPVEVPEQLKPIADRPRVILNVGSIGRLKNQEFLLRVFAKLEEKVHWELKFVGEGPDRAKLEAVAASLGVQGRVQFLGERRDVGRLLAEAQVFAFTSLSEGLPNALAEALASGCACISFDCLTGPAELIVNDENGLLIQMGKEMEYQQQLSRLLSDEGLRARLSKQANQDMRAYSKEKVLRQFEEVLLASLDST